MMGAASADAALHACVSPLWSLDWRHDGQGIRWDGPSVHPIVNVEHYSDGSGFLTFAMS